MSNSLEDLVLHAPPTAARPLLGLTVLVVEDSRFACEALRLLCLRSGARIRRADRLQSARRHLATYRPSVAIIDLGLPDGSGNDLIHDLTGSHGPRPVVIGTSGDDEGATLARAAGADSFLAKPVENLAVFQDVVLSTLPPDMHPPGPRAVPNELIVPDRIALRDDLAHAEDVLNAAPDDARISYVTRFLTGIARSARDAPLESAATAVLRQQETGQSIAEGLDHLSSLVRQRLANTAVV